MPHKIVFPVRPDRDTDWAVSCLLRIQQREPIVVDLLSVQTPFDGNVRMFFSEEEIRAFHDEDAERELAPVRRKLDAAGIPYQAHIVVGCSAKAIAKFAREHHASQIVLGPVRGRGLSEMVLGSLTRQIEHLMESAGSRCEVL
jgi:nucleotide-binding universal stress UspA family protein